MDIDQRRTNNKRSISLFGRQTISNTIGKLNSARSEKVQQRQLELIQQQEINKEYLKQHQDLKSNFYNIVKKHNIAFKVKQIEEQSARWKSRREFYQNLSEKKERYLIEKYHPIDQQKQEIRKNYRQHQNQDNNDNSSKLNTNKIITSYKKQCQFLDHAENKLEKFDVWNVKKSYASKLQIILNKGYDHKIQKNSGRKNNFKARQLSLPICNQENNYFALNELKQKLHPITLAPSFNRNYCNSVFLSSQINADNFY